MAIRSLTLSGYDVKTVSIRGRASMERWKQGMSWWPWERPITSPHLLKPRVRGDGFVAAACQLGSIASSRPARSRRRKRTNESVRYSDRSRPPKEQS